MTLNRRNFILSGVGGAAFLALTVNSHADENNWLDLKDDSGAAVTNFRLPSELSTEGLPGIVWAGSANPDVTLIEFFDYNCPYCRKAVVDLDAIVKKDNNFRLGLVNNAILSVGSAQCAKVQQAVLKLYGPKKAYEFHQKLFAHRGVNDGAAAMQTVKSMGLNTTDIEKAADENDVASVLGRQLDLAGNLGFVATPSFMLNGIGILGYPGPKTIAQMISSVRTCDKPLC